MRAFEKNEMLAAELQAKLKELAGKENIKLKKIDRLGDEFKEIANKYSLNRREYYRNMNLSEVKGSFADSNRGY